jgi:hypothetical protein
LNVTVSRRDLVTITFLRWRAARRFNDELNRFRAPSPAFVANRLFAASERQPDPAREANTAPRCAF